MSEVHVGWAFTISMARGRLYAYVVTSVFLVSTGGYVM
jgi:hypothetical protein